MFKKTISLPVAITAVALALLFGAGTFVYALTVQGTPQEVREFAGLDNQTVRPPDALGGTATPFYPYDFQVLNNIQKNYKRSGMQTATTTICALGPPAATSTFEAFRWVVTTGTSTAASMVVATSTSQYATSTTDNLATFALASGAQGNDHVTPLTNPFILTPNDYVLLMTEGPGSGGYTFGGNCSLEYTHF